MINASDIFPGRLVVRSRLKPEEIARAVQEIRRIVRSVHIFNVAEIDYDFKRMFLRTENTTMVATGQTREALFKDRQIVQKGTKFDKTE